MIFWLLHNLEAFFGWLLTASWQASVLVGLVLLLQGLHRGRLNPRWHHALWLLVILRLVLPVLPESALSLFQFTPQPPPALTLPVTEPIFIQAPIEVPPPHLEVAAPSYPFSLYSLLAVVWFAGACSLLVVTWQVNRRFARMVRNAPEIADAGISKLLDLTKEELGIRRSLRLIESAQVPSPAIMGLFHPTLILPAQVREKFSDAELRFIFLHELAHLKRGDLIVQWLIALLQILHWFNPLLWFAFRRMRADREPATDALVLSQTGEADKESYGLILIKLLEHFNQRHSLPMLVGILEDKDQFKRRFKLIARFTRGAYGWSFSGFLLIAFLSVICLTKSNATDIVNGTKTDIGTKAVGANAQMLQAVQRGDAPAVQKLIDQGADPKATLEIGRTLLFAAGSPEVAELLIAHGVDPNARDEKGATALSYIGGKNAAAVARILLQHGADANVRGGDLKQTPLMNASNGATVDVLLEYGADLKAQDCNGNGVVDSLQSVDAFKELLRHGAPFDPKTDGPIMLYRAAWINNRDMVTWLLEHGVDPNTPGFVEAHNSRSPTMLPMLAATINGNVQTVKLLMQHGAEADDEMITALHNRQNQIVSLLWETGVRNISELCYQLSQGAKLSDLQKMLDKGTSANPPQDKQITPLGEAALLGNMDAVKLLIARGADVNAGGPINPKLPEATRMSPLWLAASEGQDEIVEYLLQSGAKPEPAAVWMAAYNSSPYPNQPSKDHFETIVRTLIDAGALKSVPPDLAGLILAAPIGTRHGGPNSAALKMLLDAGLSPESPMPYIVDDGEKPNTVIGYYRDYFQKNKNDPACSQNAASIKPLLDMLEAADKSATGGPNDPPAPTTPSTTSSQTNLDVPLKSNQKGLIEVGLKVVEIPDDVYLAHQAAIDAGVEKGDVAIFSLLNQLKGVSLLSTPSVSTQPGLKANIDIVREFPYPIKFENASFVRTPSGQTENVPPTPTEFVTKNIGISAEITPTLDHGNSPDHGKIILNGKFSVADFEGFSKSNLQGVKMPSFSTRELLIAEELTNNQCKGIWVPGARLDEQTIIDHDDSGKVISEKKVEVKKRMLLFVSARNVE